MCPAPAGSRLGNRVTAVRWQRMLVELGHDAAIVDEVRDACDVVIALHAEKSAEAVRGSRAEHPERPIVVALTGTDLYRDIHEKEGARRSLAIADRLVVLHDLAPLDVPPAHRAKVRVVRQSAERPPGTFAKAADAFEVAFVAHAREEKDPLRPALAARRLPPSSRVRVVHAGAALSTDMEAALAREASENARYVFRGELPEAEARALIARSSLLVLTSVMEGGANVLGEAIVARTPPVATRIPACVAALGADHPGLFAVGDTEGLASLLLRAETDRAFYEALATSAAARGPLFDPSTERRALEALLDEVAPRRPLGYVSST